jgi:hypothetical protein
MNSERETITRLSEDGRHLVIIERWLDRQVSPPRWRSKNRRRKLTRGEILYFAEKEQTQLTDWDDELDVLLEEELSFAERLEQGLTTPVEEAEQLVAAHGAEMNPPLEWDIYPLLDYGFGRWKEADELLARHAKGIEYATCGRGQWHVYLDYLRAGGHPDDFRGAGGV